MTRHSFLLAAAFGILFAPACSKTIDDGGAADVDFRSAKHVVASIFFAAQHGQADHLASLCDPEGSSNKHARRICSQTVGGDDWSAFEKQFKKGRIIGEARTTGDRAMLNFVFGPSGTDSETMELVRRNGRWHLVAF